MTQSPKPRLWSGMKVEVGIAFYIPLLSIHVILNKYDG
jgi:hypothetical protein